MRQLISSMNLCFLIHTILTILGVVSAAQSYIYLGDKSIREELPVATLITDLRAEITEMNIIKSEQEINNEQFTLLADSKLSRGNVYFKLDPTTGELTTNQYIDREAMCLNRLCADPCVTSNNHFGHFNGSCRLNLKVLMLPSSNILNFNVFIEDVNDNRPLFRSQSLTKMINENVPRGYKIPVELAYDPDIGQNRIQFYEIVSDSELVQGTFELSQNLEDAQLHLVVIGELDREKVSLYEFKIAAYDGGKPALRNEINVTIEITDINDNNPVFEQSFYNFSVYENLSVDSKIGRVRAMDMDIGLNSLIKYSFVEKPTMARIKTSDNSQSLQYFELDEQTGIIRLKKHLDYERSNTHMLTIEARDSGVGSLPTLTTVQINVIDINDNKPQISVSFLNMLHKNTTDGRTYDLYLPENTQTNKFLAHVNINDPDANSNGKIDWKISLNGQTFTNSSHSSSPKEEAKHLLKLVRLNTNSFTINVGNSNLLNREKDYKYEVSIRSWDHGQPRLETSYNFSIILIDENDNVPQFARPTYEINVYENQPPHMVLIKLTATDADITEPNSQVTYSIREETARKYVEINEDTGVIQSKRSFDRETMDKLVFHVAATDGGVPKLSTTVTVILTILDKNDHVPSITYNTSFSHSLVNNGLNIHIGRYLPIGTGIIDFNAIDKDLHENSKFEFKLLPISPNLPFHLSPNGRLTVSRHLITEKTDAFAFRLVCKDSGIQSLNSTLSVHLTITDSNQYCIESPFTDNSKSKFVNRDLILADEQQTTSEIDLFQTEVSIRNYQQGNTLLAELLNYEDLVTIRLSNKVFGDTSSNRMDKVGLTVRLRAGLNISKLIIGKYDLRIRLTNEQAPTCSKLVVFSLLIGNNFMNEEEILMYIDSTDETKTKFPEDSYKAITKAPYKVQPATLLIKSDYILLIILVAIILITGIFLTFIGIICACNQIKRKYRTNRQCGKKVTYALSDHREQDTTSDDMEIIGKRKKNWKMKKVDLNSSTASGSSSSSGKPQYLLVNNSSSSSSSSSSSTTSNSNGTLIYRDPEFDEFGLNPSSIQLVRQFNTTKPKSMGKNGQRFVYSSTLGGRGEVNAMNVYDSSNTDRSSSSATNSIVESTTVDECKSTSDSNNEFEIREVVKTSHLMVKSPKYGVYKINGHNEQSPSVYSSISDNAAGLEQGSSNKKRIIDSRNLACQDPDSPTSTTKFLTFTNRNVKKSGDTIHAAAIINNNMPRNSTNYNSGYRTNVRTSFNL